MTKPAPLDLRAMDRKFFEALAPEARVELLCRLQVLAVEQAERLAQNSTNSSRPPSSDGPFAPRGGGGLPGLVQTAGSAAKALAKAAAAAAAAPAKPGPGKKASSRKAGKQKGAKGVWRSEPLEAERTQDHYPAACAACGDALQMWASDKGASAHFVLDLERQDAGIRVACVLHRYHALGCCGCGHITAARPGLGALSTIEGRSRDLLLSETSLVGPALAVFIAGLFARYHLSRAKIREFLKDWLSTTLSTGTIDRCIREVGVACEPVAEALLDDVRAAAIIHADETPWHQQGSPRLRWLWVVLSSTTAVYRVGSRGAVEIRDLIGQAFLGWLVSDGYGVYRSFKKRQRCLAHLIRKGVALAEGLDPVGVTFGAWLVRELRALIHEVAEDAGCGIINPILARLGRACSRQEYARPDKIRKLAREILNDWSAITAFVNNPDLPPTNNDAERALRDAVIARRISHGTRTEEGSAAFAATLSVMETCRRRGADIWKTLTDILARARSGMDHQPIPMPA
jgi:hypothetical protein